MGKMIVGSFTTYQQAFDAVQLLVENNIDRNRINLISPNYLPRYAGGMRPEEAERTKEVAGLGMAALTAVTTIAFFGLGLTLLAGPLAALVGTHRTALNDENVQHAHFEQLLIDAGIATSNAEARAYVNDVLSGNSVVAVEAADDQRDLVTDIFHRSGGAGLVYRSVDQAAATRTA